jgi:DNA gyrase subunit A
MRSKTKFAVPRRSEFTFGGADMDDEDLIEREDMVVTVTHGGYVKRTPLSTYRTQHRGGKGRSGISDEGRGFRHAGLHGEYAYRNAVLQLRRHGL